MRKRFTSGAAGLARANEAVMPLRRRSGPALAPVTVPGLLGRGSRHSVGAGIVL